MIANEIDAPHQILQDTGIKVVSERAYEAAVKIIEDHKSHPLPEGVAEMLREMVIEFDKEQV